MYHSTYVLGSSPRELSRLMLQAQIIRPTTERLLRQAGIEEGSRVLDLGCGVGDVSMLAAEIVGPSGSVVGIDQSAEMIANAEIRARENAIQQIDFEVSSVETFSSAKPFDAVIGRYVLIHQVTPANFIRAAQQHVRPGGAIAFHEISCHRGFRTRPSSPLFEEVDQLIKIGTAVGFPRYDAAGRLVELFRQAGLPHPQLFTEIPVGGGANSNLYAWMAETLRSLLPSLAKQGASTEDSLWINTLEERLRLEAVEMQSQVEIPIQVCAWAMF